jgi:glutamyl-tRNA synthetase
LLAWLSIRSRGGRVVLRIEDLDSPRVKSWAVAEALEDLKWLGLDWDEGPDVGGPHGPYVQSQRLDRYRDVLAALRARELIYPCNCTRTDVAAAASAPHAGQEGVVYPGTCSQRRAADAASLRDGSYVWRFRLTDEFREFSDRVAGQRSCRPATELGDFVVGRSDGTPAYQLAVVVDDHEMGISEVLRGDDLIPSVFRQLALYDALGWTPPAWSHVPLVVGPDGRRLAKRHGDTRLSVLRRAGHGPQRLLGWLAWSCGLRPTAAEVSARDLLADFSLSHLPPQPLVLTEEIWNSLVSRS